ncbi:hypothetical protein C2845_PM12G05590 [Panicum miliaceum]|uniref:Uncharacterized protein n=1 Tax=Panicum miliaceum TaxID=4540 RepID=A0A3L6QHX8_PANMI|nr:hypothetical protein C2845_PM12G05590 [Panicum miliaceum]
MGPSGGVEVTFGVEVARRRGLWPAPSVRRRGRAGAGAPGLWREQMVRVLAVALECTADEAWKRPTMPDVVKGLKMAQLMKPEPHDLQVQGRVVQT